MNTQNNHLINTLLAVEWIGLITVMLGGEFLHRLLVQDGDLSKHTETYFRAGHAHAGVLIGVGMALLLTLARLDLTGTAVFLIWATWFTGVVMLAGGFFWHAYLGKAGEVSFGVILTGIGGAVMAVAAIATAWNLFRSA